MKSLLNHFTAQIGDDDAKKVFLAQERTFNIYRL